ncbi:hypothetical protein ABMZ67_23570 [Pseudomonas aeruginosa]|uniref:hypothetical protein n=1 Tax=Pseudomonas aeruginosa TaxID=287 RepID=UPI00044EAD87|nr:hypothetical protein [Pseudomonas aeruginosa]ALZ14024.1 hypothetical protein HV98_15765 [Pseudomonas aeruginosa]EJB8390323.1 hypothetical protein [Pseudomonas aeruginosa]ELK4745134.1 hypothetical protein [Pseudomonas aeruginosa]EMB2837832.1 hypothetical protein [Pseudomonas aeruginosa]EZN57788.1 hypothetical protein AJ73_00575 [Pseudomonas aeruginosa BWH033]
MDRRTVFPILLALLMPFLGGCTRSLMEDSWPVPPDDIVNYPPPQLAPNPAKFEQLSLASENAEGLRVLINKHSTDSSKRDWGSGDFTTVGTIAAVGGAVADQTGLMNTGAGMSILGLTARERYKYNIQSASYVGARKALECMLSHVSTTNNDEVEWGMIQQGSAETQQAASELPATIVQATLKVKESLITRLQTIQSEPVKAADFKGVLDQQHQAYNDMAEAEKKLKQTVDKDRQALVQMKAVGFTPSVTDSANANRISKEERLVPLERQVSTGKKLVALPAAINACVAGY